MKMMWATYLLFFLISFSLLNRIDGEEICDNSLPYGKCSLNTGCGCLSLSYNNNISVCAYLYISCSELSSCAQDNKTCYQPGYICVNHSRCQYRPLCYPMKMATHAICPLIPSTSVSPIPDDGICANATWNTNGTTVAGGNKAGSELNQLQYPFGIVLDDDSNLYIADSFNHRIIKWHYGSSVGKIVAGGNDLGNRSDQFRYPNSLTIAKNGTMFICDNGNHRLQKWEKNAREGETIISNITCTGIYIDNQDSLYYSDVGGHKIVKWPENEIIAGGNSEGSQLNQLSYPNHFFIKNNKSIFIADGGNNRIVEWIIGDKEGIIRAGGNGPGHNLDQFYQPMSVIIDQSDNLYVVDYDNNRIMRWLKNSKSGIVLIGEGEEDGHGKDQLMRPTQALFDKNGNLWICDEMDHRIQMFTIDKSACKK
ncbi:unnamed protein product [Rotaria sordida]|uniref:Uncharacterized protein n=1 Tax=Rotaria sordida TaxID=392033 RepID=A0A814JCH1_9BILA|nr:unnamed protein product [Rotaria sordida]CAF3637867.1 unnamed protein product [Rotaria sordida]